MTTTLPKCHNPYASALDGLKLDNPVEAFFKFCKERESIRLKREQGLPGPWTQDEVFQRGRFLNVFREDDRGEGLRYVFISLWIGVVIKIFFQEQGPCLNLLIL